MPQGLLGRSRLKGLDLGDLLSDLPFGFQCVEGILEPQEIAFRQAKKLAQSQVRIGRDAACSSNNRMNAIGRHADRLGELVLAHADLIQKLCLEDFTRMWIVQLGHGHCPLVIINDFYVQRFAIVPSETETPLLVDADAPLTHAVSLKGLQPISRRIAQVLNRQRSVELTQLSQRPVLNIAWKLAATLALPDALGLFVGERPDQFPPPEIIRDTYQICAEASRGNVCGMRWNFSFDNCP